MSSEQQQIAKDGSLFSYGNNFFSGQIPESNPRERRKTLMDPGRAFDIAAETLQLGVSRASDAVTTSSLTETQTYGIQGASGTTGEPKSKLAYYVKNDGTLALTWKVTTRTENDYVASYVDAETDAGVLGVIDYVAHATYEVL